MRIRLPGILGHITGRTTSSGPTVTAAPIDSGTPRSAVAPF